MRKGTMIQDFRQKVLEKKSEISDKEILLSGYCHAYFENLIEAITKLFNQKIHLCIVWTDDEWTAFATNRYELMLNMNNEYVLGVKERIDKVVIAKGITIHECGHLLFTDYHLLDSVYTVFAERRQLFPQPKCSTYTEWLTDAVVMDNEELTQWEKIYKRLENSIEDGFIEYKLLSLLPGEGQCLYAFRKVQFAGFESVKVMKAKGYSNPVILFNCILMLAKYNTVLMDADDTNEPAIATLLDNYNLIRQAVQTEKSYDRIKLINEIFCNLYHFMKEDSEKESGDGGRSDNQGENNEPDEEESDNQDESSEPDEEESENSEDKDNPSDTADESDQDNDSNNQDNSSNNPKNADDQQGSSQDNPNQSKSCSPSDLLANSPTEMNEQVNTGSGSVLNDNNINQKPIPPARNKEEKVNNLINGTGPEETAQIPSPQDKLLVDNIENSIAEQAVMDEAEKELAESLQQEVEEFDFTEFNKNIDILLIRKDPSEEAYNRYENAMREIGFLVKKTVNELKNKIKDQQQGGKLNGMYNGRYLDRNNLHRFDMRIMCKNELPEDIPNMAVSILIDSSGSMSRDDKWWYAVLTALTIYLVCRELDIPVMVYSHSAEFSSCVTLTALADFNSVDGKDKYRICDLTPEGGNRDGMALRFCSEKLANRPEQNKFQMIISDGLPSAYSSDEAGKADIRNVLMDYAKKNVKYIAFGLGNEQDRIEKIYVQDLSSNTAAKFVTTDAPEYLPKMFVKAIKDLIKV